MKRIATMIAAVLAIGTAAAQTLNVVTGNVTYQFPAAQAGEMTYSDGTTLTIMDKSFTLSDVTSMYVDETSVTDFRVGVVYSNSGDATVTIPGNVAQYVTATVSGNTVTLTQSSSYAGTDYNGTADEITYQLSGESSNGSLTLGGAYKCTVSLAGLTLTNPSGPAINISNKKRIQLSAKKNTTNTLTDCSSGSQKACIYSKGQLQLQGNGTLNVVGNTKHAIKSASYVSVKNLTLNITSAVSDGISCEEYFQMKSGTVTISGVGDDGIQCDLDEDDSNTGETTDHEDENSGNIYIEGGTLNITVTADAAKGIKAAGDIRVSQDTSTDTSITVKTSGGGTWDSTNSKTKACAGMSADGDMTVTGGTLTLTSSGAGGKGINVDGTLTVAGGTINATTTGAIVYYSNNSIRTTTSTSTVERIDSNYKSSPKAIKAGTKTEVSSARANAPGGGGWPGGGGGGGNNNTQYTYSGGIVITGGTITAIASYHEAIESKSTIEITGGYVYAQSSDDAINSASDFTISGGYVMGNSSGNDGLDANGNFYIKGGNVFAIGTRSPELGIDANTEGGYKLYITGGNVAAIGGLENGYSATGVSVKTVSYSKGSWYSFNSGSNVPFYFKVPSNSSMGTSMTIVSASTPSVSTASGVTSDIWNGYGKTN